MAEWSETSEEEQDDPTYEDEDAAREAERNEDEAIESGEELPA